MGLNDYLFQSRLAMRAEVDQLARRARFQRKHSRRRKRALQARVEELEEDLGYLTLVLGALLGKLNDRGAVTLDDLRASLAEFDAIDGVADGKLDIEVLRELASSPDGSAPDNGDATG